MAHSHVLGPANGAVPAAVMFIGEAPGRRGAARTGRPFHGDEAGRRFDAFLALAGLRREEVFVTNAVLCNPVDALGRNRPPRPAEVRRCRPFLEAQLTLADPWLVVALGGVALAALGRIEPHGLLLARDRGRLVSWRGRCLVALYHPGRRSLVHRNEPDQRSDWRALGRLLRVGA
jgi:uracil-DNA glycosylase family 4